MPKTKSASSIPKSRQKAVASKAKASPAPPVVKKRESQKQWKNYVQEHAWAFDARFKHPMYTRVCVVIICYLKDNSTIS